MYICNKIKSISSRRYDWASLYASSILWAWSLPWGTVSALVQSWTQTKHRSDTSHQSCSCVTNYKWLHVLPYQRLNNIDTASCCCWPLEDAEAFTLQLLTFNNRFLFFPFTKNTTDCGVKFPLKHTCTFRINASVRDVKSLKSVFNHFAFLTSGFI